ncbi:M48 family metallopeptidase [Lentisphaerota bacterium WC36G]|nr:M48 family metallopeptidase [Lentisphaerae bacterium WC36]
MAKLCYNMLKVTLLIMLIVLTNACRSVPYTNRCQLLILSESKEQEIGVESWEQLKKQYKKSTNERYNDALKRVGRNLSIAIENDYDWEFIVFDNKQANAFCLPGGKVGVFSGLFDYTANDAELATVVGHEIAHAIARHSGEQISQDILKNMASTAAGIVLESQAASALTQATLNVGVSLPYSRKHEYEADHLGLIFMAKAGYHPQAALNFWKKFGEISQVGAFEVFLSTHPMSEDRLEELQKLLPEAMKYYNECKFKRGTGVQYNFDIKVKIKSDTTRTYKLKPPPK